MINHEQRYSVDIEIVLQNSQNWKSSKIYI